MNRKTNLTITALILFLITTSAIAPSNHAVEWSADIRLTLDNSSDLAPSIAQASDGNIWVVWSSDRTGNYELFYKVYDSSSWSDATQLTTDPQYDFHPAIMQANDTAIWVVWDSDRNLHDLDLYYKVFNGSSWSSDMQLTADPTADDYEPSIMQVIGGMVWVVFSKFIPLDDIDEDIYYKLFNGTLWSNDIRLTWDPGADLRPSVTQASNGTIWIVWESDRNGHDWNIYHKVFDTYWTPDTKLTTHLSDDFRPSITHAENPFYPDGIIWIAWTSTRFANFDIYYKTTMIHNISVISVKANSTIVVQGETVSIEVTTQNQGNHGETFEVQCYANSTLIGSTTIFLSPGQTHTIYPPFEWNTTGIPRGTYIISATAVAVANEYNLADNYREADEPVEVRLLGDICGMYDGVILSIPNGMVDGLDFAVIALPRNIFSEYPTWDPVWGPICDLNKDGRIGVADLMIVGIHYGEM